MRTWTKWYGPKPDAVAYDDNERVTLVTRHRVLLAVTSLANRCSHTGGDPPPFNVSQHRMVLLIITKHKAKRYLGFTPLQFHSGSAEDPPRIRRGT